MSTQIDSLEVKIATTIGDSVADVERLAKTLEKLQGVLGNLNKTLNKVGNHAKLPTQMKNLASATDKATESTKRFGDGLSSMKLFASIQNMQELTSAINFVSDAFGAALGQAMEWDGIMVRFGRAFGDDAKETYEYLQKINDVMGINVQEFMQYSSMYGSLLSGFGLDQDKVTTIATGLSELTYDLWAANNDVVKRYEDAATAVKSAITGEIEPIRNLGIAMTEASLQEYIDSTHLAGISIEKLSEAQKAEVRYAAMVNGAMNQGIVGTYAKEMNTAEGAVRSLTQSFKGLVQAFGSLFIPIIQMAIPYVTAFVEILTDAVRAIAKFFGINIQKIDWSGVSKGVGGMATGANEAATGLGKATKAAKKLRDYTMGFDELNVINPDSGASGSGGSGGGGGVDWGTGLDLDTLWDDAVFESASKRVDEIKQKILDFADKWKWAFAVAGVALAGFAAHKAWAKFKDSKVFEVLSKAIGGVIRGFNEFKMGMNGSSFAPLYGWIQKIVSGIRTFANFLKLPVWGGFAVIIASIVSVIVFLSKNWEEVTQVVKNFFKENISPKLEDIRKHFNKMWDSLKEVKDAFVSFGKAASPIFEVLGGIIFSVVGGVIATAFNLVISFIENAMEAFSGIVQVVSGVIRVIVGIFTKGDVGDAWNDIWMGVINFLKGAVEFCIAPVVSIVKGIISWFTNLWDELVGHSIVPDIVNGIVEWFKKLPGHFKTILGNVWDKITDFFSVSKWKKKVTDVIDTIKKNFKMPDFPKIKLSVTWDKSVTGVKKVVTEALGLDGWPNLKWSTYATGGMPSMGEMFIAREAGPELVGRIGNRSTVANNDQIVTAVSEGVYAAVRSAMSENGNGGSQNINVYLDSKQIHASVKRTDEARGRNIMGNQLGYLY